MVIISVCVSGLQPGRGRVVIISACVRTTARKRSCGYHKCVCQDYSQEEVVWLL